MKRLLLLLPFSLFAETVPYGNPSHAAAPHSRAVEMAVEYLLLQPFEEGIAIAIRNDDRQESAGATINFNTKWQSAVRCSIGYAPSFTLRAAWTDFHTKNVNHAHESTDLSGVGLIGIWMPAIDENVLYAFAAMSWKIDFDTVDLTLGKRFKVSNALLFNPYCSVRWAMIGQHFHTVYSLPSDAAHLGDEVQVLNDFHGIGPGAGMSAEWGFAHGWMIFAEGTAALLQGKFRTHSGFSSAEQPSEELLNSVDAVFSRMVPVADFYFGLGWGKTFSKKCRYLGWRLCYENHIYWEQSQWRRAIGSDAPATALLETHDLSVQGFSLRGELEF
jgi:hypothetical protein